MTAWFAAEILAAVLIVLAVKLRRVTNNCAEQEETIRELKRESTVGLQRERDKG